MLNLVGGHTRAITLQVLWMLMGMVEASFVGGTAYGGATAATLERMAGARCLLRALEGGIILRRSEYGIHYRTGCRVY